MDPSSLKFAKTHEWVSVDGEIATIGISEFAVKELSDVVHVELPNSGKSFSAGEVFGEVESVKAVSDLYAPIGGEIVEVNSVLEGDPAPLSDDPFGDGWIVKLKVENADELDSLMDYAAYQASCESH
ncbi:Glycine cleavage system H protein [Thalassoglobus neptunius]|uniref:Glycine cleavage system H protein n=1 Tax=Thalassoglobus neptunius TaxID=1938619 RepID=A0A5C5X3J2_9PLAN|nr:glycine cleavage system protein GcvH [Thalassoglobus neptunius]TWT56871.1 Glycine cleavage system H protein [Thalassoglobus neptunius]